jgi:hypothetical protein
VPEGYFARSARIVFSDPSWLWRSAVLGLVTSVPILGPVFTTGYWMALMRDRAWGVERGLPPFSESGEFWRHGWRGLVVSLVWSLALLPLLLLVACAGMAATATLTSATDKQSASDVLSLTLYVVLLLLSGVLNIPLAVAQLRTAVYLKIEAGLSISAVRDLVRRHKEGFWRVTGLMLAVLAVGGAAGLVPTILRLVLHLSSQAGLLLAVGWGLSIAVLLAPLHLVVRVAYGLWGHETQVSTWPPLVLPDTSAPVQQWHTHARLIP